MWDLRQGTNGRFCCCALAGSVLGVGVQGSAWCAVFDWRWAKDKTSGVEG